MAYGSQTTRSWIEMGSSTPISMLTFSSITYAYANTGSFGYLTTYIWIGLKLNIGVELRSKEDTNFSSFTSQILTDFSSL